MLIDYLLIFLGLRKNVPQKQKLTRHLTTKKVIQRKLVIDRRPLPDNQRQPRSLTRELYRNRNLRELSPDPQSGYDSPVSSDSDGEHKHSVVRTIEKNSGGFMSWAYSLFVFSVLSVQPVYSLWYTLTDNQKDDPNVYIASLFFNLIPVTQYILAIRYFQTTHFDDSTYKINWDGYVVGIIALVIATNVISQIIISGVLDTEHNDGDFPGYETFTYRVPLSIFLWVSWTYGKMVLYTNIVCFSVIFLNHRKTIRKYVTILNKTNDKTVNVITNDVLRVRNEFELSKKRLKGVFSMYTILGAIGIGLFLDRIQDGNFKLFPWQQFILYSITQLLFLFVVITVNKARNDLAECVRKPIFIDRYLKRYDLYEITTKMGTDTQMVCLNVLEENATIMDWMLLNDLINENWTSFTVLGIDMADGNLINKSLVFVSLVVLLYNII